MLQKWPMWMGIMLSVIGLNEAGGKGVKSTIDPCKIIGKIQNTATKSQRQT